jgi:hypothetical protein
MRGPVTSPGDAKITVGGEPEKPPEKEDEMFNLTLSERNYLVEVKKEEIK